MTESSMSGERRLWSEDEVRALGVATDLVTAGAVLGIGRTTAHALARAGRFPVPVLRVGRRYRVPVAPILRLLTCPTAGPATWEADANETSDSADAASGGDTQRT